MFTGMLLYPLHQPIRILASSWGHCGCGTARDSNNEPWGITNQRRYACMDELLDWMLGDGSTVLAMHVAQPVMKMRIKMINYIYNMLSRTGQLYHNSLSIHGAFALFICTSTYLHLHLLRRNLLWQTPWYETSSAGVVVSSKHTRKLITSSNLAIVSLVNLRFALLDSRYSNSNELSTVIRSLQHYLHSWLHSGMWKGMLQYWKKLQEHMLCLVQVIRTFVRHTQQPVMLDFLLLNNVC